jgi:hypothetical protein
MDYIALRSVDKADICRTRGLVNSVRAAMAQRSRSQDCLKPIRNAPQ